MIRQCIDTGLTQRRGTPLHSEPTLEFAKLPPTRKQGHLGLVSLLKYELFTAVA